MRAKETFVSLKLRQDEWEAYRSRELKGISPILQDLGFTLDAVQPQIGGERYLMSGHKLVLLGSRLSDGKRVVIKVSSYPDGVREIERERNAQQVLHTLNFAVRTFFSPEELAFLTREGYTIRITTFIQQDMPFLVRPLDEQFFLALRMFETQEGVHATTYAHARTIRDIFGMVSADEYLEAYDGFQKSVLQSDPDNTELADTFAQASAFLHEHRTVIERYCGFLTHHDLSLHNMRVVSHDIYLLDHTSLYFGNKYEGWARFLNFMTQYDPALEQMLVEYVHQNRSEEEYLDLRLMRVFKVGLLLQFHTNALGKTSGDLSAITRLRVTFWTEVLNALLDNARIPDERIVKFRNEQEALRTEEERNRNKEALSTGS